jgi:hypothetical protein
VTNAIAAFYVQQNDQIRSQEAAQTTAFLKTQLDEAKKALDKQEQGIQSYNARNSGQLPQQFELNLATLDRLNTQLRINGEAQLRAIEQRGRNMDDALILESGGGSGNAADDKGTDRLERLKTELKEKQTQFTDKHPDVQRLKDEIARIEKANAEAPPTKVAGAPAVDPAELYSKLGKNRRQSIQSLDAEIARLKEQETRCTSRSPESRHGSKACRRASRNSRWSRAIASRRKISMTRC